MDVFTYPESSPWGGELHNTEACSGREEERMTSWQRRMLERKEVLFFLGWLLQNKERVPLNDMGSGPAAPELHSHMTLLKMHLENFRT